MKMSLSQVPRLFMTLAFVAGCLGYPPSSDEALDDFFSLSEVHQIEIQVDQTGMASLLDSPREYVHAQVEIDGKKYEDVGVRLKGGAGSFIPLDGDYPEISGDGNGRPGKSAFIIDFNRYEKGVNHLGLKKLTLNNLVQDNSCIHEYLGYFLFRKGGVPASRSGFATVWFNGEEKGLYAPIETPDNDEFLEKWFSTNEGNLYEGEYGSDLREESVELFDQDNGTDQSRQDLRELVAALDDASVEEDSLQVLEQYLDLPEYLTYAATEIFLGHWDGYARSANNYMIHHNPDDDRWSFLPWGIDQLFIDDMGRYSGVLMYHGGRVHQFCLASFGCRARLHQAFLDVFDRVVEHDLVGLAYDARDLVESLALAESTEFGDPQATIEALDQVVSYTHERRSAIEEWLPCLLGETVDHDGDNFDGCTTDCDDHHPAVYPGAIEQCNFRDDDCNGVLDDPPECPKCFDEQAPDGGSYSLCFEPVTWEQARQACQDRGQDLASIHDMHTFEHLTVAFIERAGIEMSWIGLNDRNVEGEFVWTDGSPVDFENWGPESPKPWGEHEDCVSNAFHGWMDVPCEEHFGFICKQARKIP
jgi:hypothetical protein